ncbi:hypothetical protein GCM10027456_39670 [Kineosporia babensis]
MIGDVISWRVPVAWMVLGMTTSQKAQTGSGTQPNTQAQGEQKTTEQKQAGQSASAASAPETNGRKGGRRGTVKMAALRKARAVKMARDTRVMEREASVEAALTGFYQAQGESEEIMRAATERAQQIVAQAQERCAAPRHDMELAVARLHELGETAVSLRELTGLGAVALREILEAHTDGRRLSGPRRHRRLTASSSQQTACPTAPDSSDFAASADSLRSSGNTGSEPTTA